MLQAKMNHYRRSSYVPFFADKSKLPIDVKDVRLEMKAEDNKKPDETTPEEHVYFIDRVCGEGVIKINCNFRMV